MTRLSNNELRKLRISYGVTKLNELVVAKFEEAFAIGATVNEACFYADVHPATYYRWMTKYPELCDRFDKMRQKLPLKSKENIARQIQIGDIGLSRWLIERQQPDLYAETLKIRGSVVDDSTESHPEDEVIRQELKKRLLDNIRKRAVERANKPKSEKV